MRLHHFTHASYAQSMLDTGVIMTAESNIGAPVDYLSRGLRPIGEHLGPDVVWLTESTSADRTGIADARSGKGDVRVTVEVPDGECHRWSDWAFAKGIHPEWYDALGRNNDPENWWVVEREVPHAEWVEITTGPISGVGRNDQCPCGSTRKFKSCHSGRRQTFWTPADGVDITRTTDEVRKTKLTATFDAGGVTYARNADGETVKVIH